MKHSITAIAALALAAPLGIVAAELTTQDQIAQAVSPLPESRRAGTPGAHVMMPQSAPMSNKF